MTPIYSARHPPLLGSVSWVPFVLIMLFNAFLAAFLLFLEFVPGISYWNLVRDTNAIANQPPYFGAYSNAGILFWAAAGSIALFSWFLLRQRPMAEAWVRPLLFGGLFMAIAGLDDMFMLHENAYLLGIPEPLALAAYAALLLAFVTATLPVLSRSEWPCLGAALALLAVSTLADLAPDGLKGRLFVEEVSKLAGIVFLAFYVISLAFAAWRGILGEKLTVRETGF